MKKRMGALLLGAVLAVTVCGCGHEHDFQPVSCDEPLTCTICHKTEGDPIGHDFAEATCTEPKTCKRCGETEGEALGHDFSEATCTEPKTCKRCGETEGEALGHQLTEANYQDPPTCERCGATVGEPMKSSFEAHGLKLTDAKPDEEIPYVTGTYDGKGLVTHGTARFSALERPEEGTIFTKKDGYETLAVSMQVDYTDDAAWENGYMTGICLEDYYTIEFHDDTTVYTEKTPEEYKGYEGYSTYKVNFHGKEYECEKMYKPFESTGWIGEKHALIGDTYYFHVPVGYDGTVIGLYHNSNDLEWKDGMYIFDIADDDAIFYRLKD
ncbi:MAG: hypothetical protein K6G16_09535 [Lachnospiraceae bacterium]|nr:hypothetical protein [Lachnospiraceae bacterium]